ncbi:MAG: MBL fold hydrolase [Pirellulaceae bacterium]|nr:MAG: MBL fold hydrolase [Pirellulaceae bacterium]GIW94104.1 MAG: MBL fold hydrolase [Pirellulaceae bacterium]
MRLHFLGANRQVTGSRYAIERDGEYVMVDCGLFQEREYLERNWAPCPVPVDKVTAVVLTHVHIDHCGWLPRLVQQGFDGPIYATAASTALARIMLLDAAKIQMEDAAYKKKRHEREGRRGKYPEVPLYTDEDAEQALRQFRSVPYRQPITVAPDLEVTFHDAGHVLGSAILEFRYPMGETEKKLVFSGDLGQKNKPIIRDPDFLREADYVVMESTYGDRLHERSRPVVDQLADVISRTLARGGRVVIPTFALERTQELLYHISDLVQTGRIRKTPVFVDSPMAADITEVFRQFPDCFDQQTWQRLLDRRPPWQFEGLHFTRTVEESKQINEQRGPCIILSTSGMCTEGRIKHHLRAALEDDRNTVVFVGFQAHGTLGRRILEREPEVRIHGRQYRVRCEVAEITGFSAHADQQGLLDWLGAFEHAPTRTFLTHGEEKVSLGFAELIRNKWNWAVSVPEYGQRFALA